MKRRTSIILLLVMTAILSVGFAEAGSIWAKKSKNMKSLMADDTAAKVGDILTIIISENTEIEKKRDKKLQHSTSRSASFDGKLGMDHSLIPITIKAPSFSVSEGTGTSRDMQGKADYKDESEITDKVSVIVEDVHPNGNLVVIGKIQRTVSGDKQIINVSGIVRPSDITFTNTIKSEQIANFHMVIESEGDSENYTKTGWLGGILDYIWPF